MLAFLYSTSPKHMHIRMHVSQMTARNKPITKLEFVSLTKFNYGANYYLNRIRLLPLRNKCRSGRSGDGLVGTITIIKLRLM